MNKKKIYIFSATILLILILILLIIRNQNRSTNENSLFAIVNKGPFEVTIITSGELEAKNSVKVFGPQNLRRARVWNIKVADIVAEGTSVKKGDYIAQLDRTEVAEGLKNAELDLENKMLELSQVKIDTALELQQARNNLENLQSSMLEKKLEIEKSKFEPPVIIEQAEAEYTRAARNFEQAKSEYSLKLNRNISKVRSSTIKKEKTAQRANLLRSVLAELTILAPEEGMVIYRKDHRGEKTAKGSMMSTWDPVVAELPDLSLLISKTFVNEVDIRKIAIDQVAEITFDAFPDKKMTGKIISVANVGETIFGGKAKVFRVDLLLDGTDNDIKPGMTTGNSIITSKTNEAFYIPIETVYSQGDSLSYVFFQNKFRVIKKEVMPGQRNDQDIQILKGLKENDKVLFSPPINSDKLEFQKLDGSAELTNTN